MNSLKVGIATLEQYKKRTMAIARGQYVPARGEPKVWFQSLETMSQVLSDRNRALLALIVKTQPQSLTELAETTGRAKSNLSRTLKTMERYGLVYFEQGPGRQIAPRTNYSGVKLELTFVDGESRFAQMRIVR
jgi:predicted transcriptional regulator